MIVKPMIDRCMIDRWSPAEIESARLKAESRKRTGRLPAPTLSAAVTWLKDRANWREYGLETARVAIQRADGSVPSKRTVQRKQLRISTFPRRPNHCSLCKELGHSRRRCPKTINQKLTKIDDEDGKVNEQ